MTQPGWFEYVLLCVLALVWGASYLFIKVALEAIPPASLMAFRVLVAALILFAVMRLRGMTFPPANRWPSLFVQSIFNATGAWLLLAWGQQFTDSGLAGVINSTSPLFVVVFATLAHGLATPSGRKVAGAAVGFMGVVLIIGPTVLAGLGQQVLAQLAILGGAAFYGLAALNGIKFSDLPPLVTATSTLICAAVVLGPLAIVIDTPWSLAPTGSAVMAALALAVFSTALALIIYFRLVRTLGALGTTSQAYLRAGVSLALGILVLGEVLTPITAFGLVAAIGGVVLINWPGRRKPLS